MPTSTRSRATSEEADEGGVGTRSTRSKGGAKLEDGLPSRKKTKTDASPSKKKAASKVSADRDETSSPTPDKKSSKEAASNELVVCKICGKSGEEDSRPMVTFEQLGTFHVFCGKVAAITTTNKMPQYEIAEKSALRKKYGESAALTDALEKSPSAVCEANGKVFVSVHAFHEHLAQMRPATAPWLNKTKPAAGRSNTTPKKPKKKNNNKSKAGSKRDPVVDRAVANALMARQTQEASKPNSEVKRKSCVCGHSDCYSVLCRWVAVGDDKRCGYVSLPNPSAKDTERGYLVNQFRELVFFNLRGNKNLAKEDKTTTRKFVAFHHFEHILLLRGNKGLVEFIEPALASALSLGPEYKILSGPNTGKFLPSPRREWSDMMNELVGIENTIRARRALPYPLPAHLPRVSIPPPSPAQVLEPAEKEELEKRLSEMPKDYEGLKAIYAETEKALALERKKNRDLGAQLSGTQFEMYRLSANNAQLKKIVAQMNTSVAQMNTTVQNM